MAVHLITAGFILFCTFTLSIFCRKPVFDVTQQEIDIYDYLTDIKHMKGGWFLKGVNDPRSKTGEFPVHKVNVPAFYIDTYPVTNARFWHFRRERQAIGTAAETKGWSWVFKKFVSEEVQNKSSPSSDPWWIAVRAANWIRPLGEGDFHTRHLDHPVVHVDYHDAQAFCHFEGKRLPTEEEWEYAARGGEIGLTYPWGENYIKNRSNLWQGKFPDHNRLVDGYEGISPVDAYPPQNKFGMRDMLGNIWEWTKSRYYQRSILPETQDVMYVVKGGSYMDSWDASANMEARTSQRMGLDPDYTAHNVGFRCVLDIPHHPTPPPTRKSRSKRRHTEEL